MCKNLWGGGRKKLTPLFKDLENKFDGKNVLFVNLDFTNQTKKIVLFFSPQGPILVILLKKIKEQVSSILKPI